MYKKVFKRTLDIILSLLAIICLSPLLALIALLVRIKLGSPILFKQPRPGKNEKIFYLYKFRSMTNATDKNGKLLPDKDRLTKFGKFLRKSSIDELPELFNILKGDMSIVGPRPLSMYYLQYLNTQEKRRHKVRPGLTGLAQINGRNNLSWENKFLLDLNYIDNMSFLYDIKIIFNTLAKVFNGSDITVNDGKNILKNFTSYRIVTEETEIPEMKKESSYGEIGSYFWLEPQSDKNYYDLSWLPQTDDSSFTYSGRNAIALALDDILKHQKIKKAYIPSYCCISMLQYFIKYEIKYEFYDITFRDGNFHYNIPENLNEGEIFLILSYFGLDIPRVNSLISQLKKKKLIVIEDITHSLFSLNGFSTESDYLVTSLRKWFPVPCGGWIGKLKGNLTYKPSLSSDDAIVGKIEGMKDKYEYISGKEIKKEDFLIKNAKFDGELAKAVKELEIDSLSLEIITHSDIDKIIKKRKSNCKILIDGLRNKYLDIIVPDIDLNSVIPLFLPIFLEIEKRDNLRNYLINKGIFCPIHWPEVMGAKPGIRENELSLICDQRYDEIDMNYILEVINEWHNTLSRNKWNLI